MISAKILTHTINTFTGDELVTFECTYHRFILPEVNTYRMISKNSASSRGIPVAKRIQSVEENPAIPVEWGKNCKGMVPQENFFEDQAKNLEFLWRDAANSAVEFAKKFSELGVHKQIVNRIIEPFVWQTSVFTGNRKWFEHMFAQRIHPDAQPEFRELCIKMRESLESSVPNKDVPHQPYILPQEDIPEFRYFILARMSVARCARVSYTPFDMNDPNIEADFDLYYKLIYSNPPHLSPLEHYAFPIDPNNSNKTSFFNFSGFVNLRYLFEKTNEWDADLEIENVDDYLETGFVTNKLLSRLKD